MEGLFLHTACPSTIRCRTIHGGPACVPNRLRVMASNIGDFGARDPFPAELESNFGDRVLGNASTEHVVLIPSFDSLADRFCTPLPARALPMSEDSAKSFLRKVVGWRLLKTEAGLRLQCEWKLKDFSSAIELFRRIVAVADVEGHHPELHVEGGNIARAEIWSRNIGGLSENDFILAAKIDRINTSDLVNKRNKFWA